MHVFHLIFRASIQAFDDHLFGEATTLKNTTTENYVSNVGQFMELPGAVYGPGRICRMDIVLVTRRLCIDFGFCYSIFTKQTVGTPCRSRGLCERKRLHRGVFMKRRCSG